MPPRPRTSLSVDVHGGPSDLPLFDLSFSSPPFPLLFEYLSPNMFAPPKSGAVDVPLLLPVSLLGCSHPNAVCLNHPRFSERHQFVSALFLSAVFSPCRKNDSSQPFPAKSDRSASHLIFFPSRALHFSNCRGFVRLPFSPLALFLFFPHFKQTRVLVSLAPPIPPSGQAWLFRRNCPPRLSTSSDAFFPRGKPSASRFAFSHSRVLSFFLFASTAWHDPSFPSCSAAESPFIFSFPLRSPFMPCLAHPSFHKRVTPTSVLWQSIRRVLVLMWDGKSSALAALKQTGAFLGNVSVKIPG